jgi:hypothetical protein
MTRFCPESGAFPPHSTGRPGPGRVGVVGEVRRVGPATHRRVDQDEFVVASWAAVAEDHPPEPFDGQHQWVG